MMIIERARAGRVTSGVSSSPGDSSSTFPRGNLRNRLLLGDAVAALVAWGGALWITGGGDRALTANVPVLVLAVVATLLALRWQQLYRARVAANRSDEIARVGRAACAVAVLAVGAGQVVGFVIDGRAVAAGGAVAFLLVAYQRGRFRQWVGEQRAEGHFGRKVVVVGGTAEAAALIDTFEEWSELGFVPVAYVGRIELGAEAPPAVPWVGGTDDISAAVRERGASGVVIAASSVPSVELNRMVRELHADGVHVHLSSGISGMHYRRLRVQPVGYEPLIYVEPAHLSAAQTMAKRVLDVSLAILGLAAAAPVLLVAAVAIKLGDGGPVVFRQQRVGHRGAPFTILKLRTMCIDAEDRLVDLRERNEREGPLFKVTSDPRVTQVGRLLRATSIDELPQLLNVLRGSMSLVGPRPALPSEVDQFEHAVARHAVKPGISGLWQVEARDKPSFAIYERLDMFYVENWSVWLDIAVLVRTVRVVLRRARRATTISRHPAAEIAAPARVGIG
jgi:exopolysaccharide biosynthesis polyprenyl glycosylphosphotransferase